MDAKDETINVLREQLTLAARYIRAHLRSPQKFDARFMNMFADACENEVSKVTPKQRDEIFKTLMNLQEYTSMYYNGLYNTGKRNLAIESDIRNACAIARHILYADDSVSWQKLSEIQGRELDEYIYHDAPRPKWIDDFELFNRGVLEK